MHRIAVPLLMLWSSLGDAGPGFPLDELDLAGFTQGWGQPQARKSVDGNPLSIGGKRFDRGIGSHANADWILDLNGKALRFTAWVGHDDEKKDCGSEIFEIRVDGATRFSSGVMRPGDPAKRIEVDLKGAKRLRLIQRDAGDGMDCDHGDWADPRIEYDGPGTPSLAVAPVEPPPDIIRPDDAKPRINGPRITGATPGRPFLFRIPATGDRPIIFEAKGLPAGLRLDSKTGIITGSLKSNGETKVSLTARNARGQATRDLTIVAGNGKLALTPPMGWNSWNVWGCAVDQQKIEAAAEALVSSGLADHGYTYINIDDCWEGTRGPDGRIRTNEKFPDMKGLADKIHSLGLKLGIYSSPGPKTCAGYEGSWQHELDDAKTYAAWGVDYLKYDWCSYESVATGEGQERLLKPYAVMHDALAKVDRDIVFSLCQYGMGKVWEWGPESGGQLWRTTGDITDTWPSLWGIASKQPEIAKYSGPGRWNDPDMLVVGKVGWGPNLHPTKLTPNEQIFHLTAWAMLGAPLLIGCDLTALDPFTRALLTNDAVLNINQDPAGRPVTVIRVSGEVEVWVRQMEAGWLAVGVFNPGLDRAEVRIPWKQLDLSGPRFLQDAWTWQDLDASGEELRCSVPAHGARLLHTWARGFE